MPHFITLLSEDHRRVEQLFEQYEQTGDVQVAQQVCLELSVHAMVEEEMLYGLYSAKVDNAGAAEARAEHQEVKEIILRLESMDASSDAFAETMAQLKASVAHHVDEEEHKMFPKILERLPETAEILGQEMVARRVAIEEQMQSDRRVGMAPSTISEPPTSGPETG